MARDHGLSSSAPPTTSPLRRRMHDTNNPFYHKSPDETRRREINLDMLKKLAQDTTATFSDDESDGVTSDDDDEDDDEDIDTLDTVLVPTIHIRIPDPCKAPPPPALLAIQTPPDKSASPDVDATWTLVDKSPTFEDVRSGKAQLGDESWSP
ncbi:hypothetical protein H310_14999 [Aphanomyces invadans]|uniref:Uncharacterized protein n=1 Tax=Aphanomyces invadans TaxID=157072 RepID=A0A024T862_9STRA|nr:hypothetical protein H310_14999 [Aphanomyces invadans]ETV90168.1 hypothetical protein H310_14999 [Aphanomyces invadans]|eukprot:XP_008881198.1 hypothetical protein H310_14999 [Aphanomyces invadans]